MRIKPGISVVVASHRPGFIKELLISLLKAAQDIKFPYEIIVVADYPIEPLRKQYNYVKWIFIDDISISKKRNCGVKKAKYSIIGFVDDDCVVDKDWLRIGYEFLLNNEQFSAVEGKTFIRADGSESRLINEYKRLEKPKYRTNNIFYRKKNFEENGSFDERFTVQREDVDLAFTVLKNGGSIAFNPSMNVYHRFRSGEWWDLLKNCWNRRFDPLLLKKHRQEYRKKIGSAFSGTLLSLLSIHSLIIISLFFMDKAIIPLIVLEITVTTAFTIRRIGVENVGFDYFIKEWWCMLVSPFVLMAALLYGSVKYKKLLLY
ncbi:glycosyltransferase [Chitinispirillales bacterium ANBcel5]|uniref:glycosyltransferase family 2 protein n=1 Tax=Cellulosispirillum alkaliphilum TaxID=3039283 RepID=UPI002A51BABA|nr:glycosyltransferase [Chitinispirillales bacterium ANBcel5]